ncbi:MAG: GNAT family N-acetyltransferase [Clostridium sp.]|uniref:GNAT family N-acetyltransferase n=1 Tax=Clostridium sp. TaxID=1506 RepID=UPI0025D9B68D|nr:GNAT family N-acetyltransferase [Clostridium sp.]MCI6692828.1 GNAT family N-acetyltransferase [Clostridium sp.]MDY2631561.1 GNAT family N-acetyltransferase [Clostridium sp.]
MKWEIKKFKELSVEELYRILELRNSVFIVEQECIYQDCDRKDLEAFHLLCIEDDKVIATLRILHKGVSYKEMSIGRVVVHKEYRRQNLGRKSMEMAIEYIKDKYGDSPIRISAQVYIKEFYKSLGFIEVSDVYLEDDIPHIEMLYEMKK